MDDRCPCGGVIFADTEDWKVPACNECFETLGEPVNEPAYWAAKETKRRPCYIIGHDFRIDVGGENVLGCSGCGVVSVSDETKPFRWPR